MSKNLGQETGPENEEKQRLHGISSFTNSTDQLFSSCVINNRRSLKLIVNHGCDMVLSLPCQLLSAKAQALR